MVRWTWWTEAWSLGPLLLQCFDTVGWVIWPVKPVPDMTYNVFSGTSNPAQSVNHLPFRTSNKVIVDTRLRPRCCPPGESSWAYVFAWPIMGNMTSLAKPKVHDVMHWRHTRTKPWPHGNMYWDFRQVWTCGLWVMWAGRQTDIQIRSLQYFAHSYLIFVILLFIRVF